MQRTVIHVALAIASSPVFPGVQALRSAAPAEAARATLSPLHRLHQERLKALAEVMESCRQRHAQGALGKDAVDAAQEAWAEAALEASLTRQEKLVHLQTLVHLETQRCQEIQRRVDVGTASREDALRATARRLSREIALLQAQTAGPRK